MPPMHSTLSDKHPYLQLQLRCQSHQSLSAQVYVISYIHLESSTNVHGIHSQP